MEGGGCGGCSGEGMQGSEPLSRARGLGRQEAEAEKSE